MTSMRRLWSIANNSEELNSGALSNVHFQ